MLCVDNFEELKKRPDEFTPDFYSTLRSCAEGTGLRMIIGSLEDLSPWALGPDKTSPLYNILSTIFLQPFSDEDASDFLVSRRESRSFSAEERKAILGFARGHPMALQVACFHLLEAKSRADSLAAALRNAEAGMERAQVDWKRPSEFPYHSLISKST